jgi:membrane-associated phospholipid phosphatase
MFALTVLAGTYLARHSGTDALDRWGFTIIRPNYHSATLNDLAQVGSPVVLGCGALVAGAVSWGHDKLRTIACLVGPALAGGLTEYALKPWFDPRIRGLQFPSGHETGASALVMVTLLVLPRRWLWLAVPAAAALLIALGAALVSLGWHTPSDALAGMATGAGAVLFADGALHLSGLARQRVRQDPDAS